MLSFSSDFREAQTMSETRRFTSRFQLFPEPKADEDVVRRFPPFRQPNCLIASPAPLKFVSFISEYFRERITPCAPPRNAASTASRVPCGVDLLSFSWVGMSISMPGQISVLVPLAPSTQRLVSRNT